MDVPTDAERLTALEAMYASVQGDNKEAKSVRAAIVTAIEVHKLRLIIQSSVLQNFDWTNGD